MKRILALFVVLLFIVGCGGGSSDNTGSVMESIVPDDSEQMEPNIPEPVDPEVMEPETSPDFEEIEIPTEFTPEDLSSESELSDAGLVPGEMVDSFVGALTDKDSRSRLVQRVRNASPCSALNDWTDKEIWDDMVDQFNLDNLGVQGSSLEEAIRNALAYDLPLGNWEEEYSKPEWSEFEIMHGVAWVALAEELGRCWDR